MPNNILDKIIYYFLWLQREAVTAVRRDFWIIVPLAGALILFAVITFIVISKSKKLFVSETTEPGAGAPPARKKSRGGNVKTVTVLSGRLLSLNHISDNSATEQTLIFFKQYLNAVKQAAYKTQGALYHNIDGSIFIEWGLRSTTGEASHDALNAIRAALILRMNLVELNKELFNSGTTPLQSISGISTGKMIGDASRKRNNTPCILGGASLLASKAAEAAVKTGVDIVITAKTWRLVEQYIIAEEIEALKHDGDRATRLFAVINLRVKDEEEQPRPTNLKELQSLLLPLNR
jgi:class 3 adenylate cyclase